MTVETDLSAADLAGLVETFKAIVKTEAGVDFPNDPTEQLGYAIEAVFKSWNGRRARDYRRMESIPDDLGTAVNVQTMVFGNKGEDSGTGVAFTRNPSSGENLPYGDFLTNAQGEDVVAGIRITEPLDAMGNHFPECHKQLLGVMKQLENHYRDMCDIEFTIEQGRLFILQTRVGKRTAAAALRMAVEMEGRRPHRQSRGCEARAACATRPVAAPAVRPEGEVRRARQGSERVAGRGGRQGVLHRRRRRSARDEGGERVILVRPETSPDDLHGMIAAEGILTSRGGLVSHAAVVARGMGKPAICGADALDDRLEDEAVLGRRPPSCAKATSSRSPAARARSSSARYPLSRPEPSGHFGTILGWADGFRTMKVRTNADLPEDAAKAREFGAEGIGLCRTEHMFLGDRLPIVQRMILAETPDDEAAALEELRAQQEEDFVGILEAMDGLPVTIRLLDPPLHEFLPDHEELIVKEALGTITDQERKLLHAASVWRESNPMLGTRGCRLGIIKPGLYRMQVARADAGRGRPQEGGRQPDRRDHDPAHRERARAEADRAVDARGGERRARRRWRRRRVPRRHDDRDAARRARRPRRSPRLRSSSRSAPTTSRR